ncbi:hypothetical protein [Niallia nealsonii]|uniref:hypothetical protein n=1 Tax=Niallia nealsonii TaxID=115979 RepID=UPI0012FEAD69|nr:hypothetical protein [Niallia nealsonii]
MDNTINYHKIIDAINQSMDIIKNEQIESSVLAELLEAQQSVQQAMSYSLSKDNGY